MTDLLTLKYISISQVELFGKNAKLHNLDQIIQSIKKYGFKSACKWEGVLNDGRGGIVAGNGRVEALRVMKRRGHNLPVGIAQDETGEWCVPVLFGAESDSEATARAYALDDNNLTVVGGDFDVADLLKLYNQDLLTSELDQLLQIGEEPVTFNDSFIENVIQQLFTESDSINKEKNLTDREHPEISNSNTARNYPDVNDDNIEKAEQKLKSQFTQANKKNLENLITCPHCGGDFEYR